MANARKILIVEDDSDLCETLVEQSLTRNSRPAAETRQGRKRRQANPPFTRSWMSASPIAMAAICALVAQTRPQDPHHYADRARHRN